mmetsp:Transcript_118394/g.264672  ORF Transcript_118394/g.264672 Transcript_118394/m.264672 type:complete len:219 (-) Transcript_118394:309-965(-)
MQADEVASLFRHGARSPFRRWRPVGRWALGLGRRRRALRCSARPLALALALGGRWRGCRIRHYNCAAKARCPAAATSTGGRGHASRGGLELALKLELQGLEAADLGHFGLGRLALGIARSIHELRLQLPHRLRRQLTAQLQDLGLGLRALSLASLELRAQLNRLPLLHSVCGFALPYLCVDAPDLPQELGFVPGSGPARLVEPVRVLVLQLEDSVEIL